MSNPVCWFEIYVQDMDRAKRFYESVFRVKLEKLDTPFEMWSFPADMERYGSGGALVKMEGVPSGANSTLVYFACADCAIEAGRLKDAGGQVTREKTSIGQYGFITLGQDTEGNTIGLHSMS